MSNYPHWVRMAASIATGATITLLTGAALGKTALMSVGAGALITALACILKWRLTDAPKD